MTSSNDPQSAPESSDRLHALRLVLADVVRDWDSATVSCADKAAVNAAFKALRGDGEPGVNELLTEGIRRIGDLLAGNPSDGLCEDTIRAFQDLREELAPLTRDDVRAIVREEWEKATDAALHTLPLPDRDAKESAAAERSPRPTLLRVEGEPELGVGLTPDGQVAIELCGHRVSMPGGLACTLGRVIVGFAELTGHLEAGESDER
ncbi:hypothetical protein [Rhodococcus jostii]|uniref:hypothetical protein n=1 Tax=Rhodococcus jostii TaxID=132919 RepID=UPI003637B564